MSAGITCSIDAKAPPVMDFFMLMAPDTTEAGRQRKLQSNVSSQPTLPPTFLEPSVTPYYFLGQGYKVGKEMTTSLAQRSAL
ncbi:jg22154 [Pararge aegeria aegeria]|uniref:Jg22154 protein n=1 Tax=Pararge aegeria aegeria TaxID=348720 RepID=A0A8S4QHE6_9NEOP|nr:jg22154 [Pararge aegeria aegeria]